MKNTILDIIKEVKTIDNVDVNERLIADLGLTSLDIMIILSLIEERCNIDFTEMAEISKCITVNDLITLVNKIITNVRE